jgi:hypothetical protein
MKTKSIRLKNGFEFTFQRIDDKVSHIIISDYNLYPDSDGRSDEIWRKQGLLIPINSDEDLTQIKKLFKWKTQ